MHSFRSSTNSDRTADLPPLDPEVARIFANYRLANGNRQLTLRSWLERAELWLIADALEKAGGNHTAAARALGIGRRTLYNRKKKLGLDWSRDGDDAAAAIPRAAAPAPAIVARPECTEPRKVAARRKR